MQIDWFTFVAQIVNFLILVGALRYFLYEPITKAMAEREQRIADRFAEAKEQEEAAEAEAASYRQKQEELEAEREERLTDAREEAREERQSMIEDARAEVERLEAQWREALRRERETFLQELAQRVSRETVDLARRALRDLADADLEGQVVQSFVGRLSSMGDEPRKALTEAIEAENGEAVIRTAFDLGDDQRRRLTDKLASTVEMDVSATFEQDAGMGVGIEVRAGGHNVAWSLNSYFAELEQRVRDRVDTEIRTGEAGPDREPAEAEPESDSVPSSHLSDETNG